MNPFRPNTVKPTETKTPFDEFQMYDNGAFWQGYIFANGWIVYALGILGMSTYNICVRTPEGSMLRVFNEDGSMSLFEQFIDDGEALEAFLASVRSMPE